MKLFHLGRQGGFRSMTVFHALARLGIEGLVVVEPDRHFLCLGYFDDAQQLVDFDFCARRNIPVMRRELGGGLVLLGPGQIFYQLIIKRGDSRLPLAITEAYRRFSKAPIGVYRRLGLEVSYRPVNDLVTAAGRKISGQGAADINGCFVFVGNILCQFDADLWCRTMKLADERFRPRIHHAMKKNLTWLARELGEVPQPVAIARMIEEEFASILDPLEARELPQEVCVLADELAREFTSKDFIFMETSRQHSAIKVKEGTFLRCAVCETAAGRVLAEVVIDEGIIKNLVLTQDTELSTERLLRLLATKLKGVKFDFHSVAQRLANVMTHRRVQPRGIDPEDLAYAIVGQRS
jgi:lipoate-protein ligase A